MLEEVLDSMIDILTDKKSILACIILNLSINLLIFSGVIPEVTMPLSVGGIITVFSCYNKDNDFIYKISAVCYAACIFLSVRNICLLYF